MPKAKLTPEKQIADLNAAILALRIENSQMRGLLRELGRHVDLGIRAQMPVDQRILWDLLSLPEPMPGRKVKRGAAL
jgi:hypothetical protein